MQLSLQDDTRRKKFFPAQKALLKYFSAKYRTYYSTPEVKRPEPPSLGPRVLHEHGVLHRRNLSEDLLLLQNHPQKWLSAAHRHFGLSVQCSDA